VRLRAKRYGETGPTIAASRSATMNDASIAVRTPREEIESRVRALGPWFHNLDLGGVQTAPDHFLGDYPRVKWRAFAHAIPADLTGQSVLDIGCNGGFYSIEMKRRGAARVVAVDSDRRYLAQARFAAEVTGAGIEFHQLSVYDVGVLGERFDLVLFLGVFYHLRHPLLALDLLHEHVVGDTLVFQSMLRGSDDTLHVEPDYPFSETRLFDDPRFPRMYFIEQKYAEDPTNWWIPNRSAAEALLRSAGFVIVDHPEREVFVCRRSGRPSDRRAVSPAAGPGSRGAGASAGTRNRSSAGEESRG
jgi:tRNA (mo5U34)-methyltransferase